MRRQLTVAATALAAITFTACEETPTATLDGGETATSGAKGAAHNNAPFPVFLDPDDYTDGLAFIYTNSLCRLADNVDPEHCDPVLPEPGVLPPPPSPYRYFPVFVAKGGGALVLGNSPAPVAAPFAAITEPGWYTFRHVFGSEADGTLTVDFELAEDGRVLSSTPITATFITGETTSSFDVADLGSGYIWFPVIAGPPLPIDEQRLRLGG